MRLAQVGSRACSASMKAATPPCFWALATACRATVVLPLDFRAEDLDDAAARQALAAQGDVEAQGPGGDARHVRGERIAAQLHDGAFAELLFDLGQGVFQFTIMGCFRHFTTPSGLIRSKSSITVRMFMPHSG